MPPVKLLPPPAQLHAIRRAVAEFVRLTGPRANRHLEAEAEAGPARWGVDVMVMWGNIHIVAGAIERALFPRDEFIPPPGVGDHRRKGMACSGWPCDVGPALISLATLMERLITRWDAPEIASEQASIRTFDPHAEEPMRPILLPTVEDDERATLEWVLEVLTHAVDWLAGAMYEAEGRPPLRVVGGEADADPRPAVEQVERSIVDELRNRRRPAASLARFVEFMIGRKSATYEDASDPIYGVPDANHDMFRKTAGRVNRVMELRRTRITYELGDGRIYKKVAAD